MLQIFHQYWKNSRKMKNKIIKSNSKVVNKKLVNKIKPINLKLVRLIINFHQDKKKMPILRSKKFKMKLILFRELDSSYRSKISSNR